MLEEVFIIQLKQSTFLVEIDKEEGIICSADIRDAKIFKSFEQAKRFLFSIPDEILSKRNVWGDDYYSIQKIFKKQEPSKL